MATRPLLAVIPALLLFSFSSLNAQNKPLPAGVRQLADLPYVDGGQERQKLDLYLPESSHAALPVILWVHGGGWAAGSKSNCPAIRQVPRGYAVASIGYRLSGEAVFPAQITDCKAAIRWLRAHAAEYHLDPKRFAVWGSSAGGHLVALLGTSGGIKDFELGPNLDQSSAVQAVCDFFGPTDLLQMDAQAHSTAPFKHDAADSPESRLIGGPIQEHREKVARANPLTFVSPDDPPFLIVHGDADPLVGFGQSELLFNALQKAERQVHLHRVKGAGHGKGFGPEVDHLVDSFFDQTLGGQSDPTFKGATRSESESVPAGAAGPNPQRPSFEQIAAREDSNHDGKVSREEFKGPGELFGRLDRDHNGVLTKEDFAPSAQ